MSAALLSVVARRSLARFPGLLLAALLLPASPVLAQAQWETLSVDAWHGEEPTTVVLAHDKLFAQSYVSGALYRSDDGGSTWTELPRGPWAREGSCLASVHGVLFVGCRRPYRSTDGETFVATRLPRLGDRERWRLNALGTSIGAAGGRRFFVSSDGGGHWQARTLPPRRSADVVVGSSTRFLTLGLTDEDSLGFESLDQGRTWSGAPISTRSSISGRRTGS